MPTLTIRFFTRQDNRPAGQMRRYLAKPGMYSDGEEQYLRDNWQTKTILEMADGLGRSYGSVKSKGQKEMGLKKTTEALRALSKRPNAGQFKKGQLPVNTIYGDEAVIRIRRAKTGPAYKWIRVASRQWQEYHRWLWLQHNQAIPDGYLVAFKNGDQMDVRIENLELITLKENALRNSASLNLSDGYIAQAMAKGNPELQQELRKHPHLIDLKRTHFQLKRLIKNHDNR